MVRARTGDHVVTLPASPEPLRIRINETAIVVVDMQNAYATAGGYVDIAGFSVEGARGAIAQTRAVVEAARAAGIPVIYFQNGWDPAYVEAGTPGSPNWHKSNALKTMRARPRAARHAARERDLGLRDRRRADAATGRHRGSENPLQRLLQHQHGQHPARSGDPKPRLYRGGHQCLRRVLAAGRVPSRIFRRGPEGRDSPSRSRLHPGRRTLQYREVLRLGVHHRRFRSRGPPQIPPDQDEAEGHPS